MFARVVEDIRSDDEDSDAEVEQKQEEGYEVGISGGSASEKKALENGKSKGKNGKVSRDQGTKVNGVIEGKKMN